MVSTRVLLSNSSSPFTSSLVTLLKAPIITGITVTFMFHNFFSFLTGLKNLFLFSLSFIFTLWSAETAKSIIWQFFFIISMAGRLTEIRESIFISKSQRSLCVSFSRTDSGLSIYYLFIWWNLNFLHNSRWINFPTQSCLVLFSFCVNLLHSRIMLLIVFVSIPTYAILLRLIYSCFDIFGLYGVLGNYKQRFNFSLKIFIP